MSSMYSRSKRRAWLLKMSWSVTESPLAASTISPSSSPPAHDVGVDLAGEAGRGAPGLEELHQLQVRLGRLLRRLLLWHVGVAVGDKALQREHAGPQVRGWLLRPARGRGIAEEGGRRFIEAAGEGAVQEGQLLLGEEGLAGLQCVLAELGLERLGRQTKQKRGWEGAPVQSIVGRKR